MLHGCCTKLAEDLDGLLVGPIPAGVSDQSETVLNTQRSIQWVSNRRSRHRKTFAALTLLAVATLFVVLASGVGSGKEGLFAPLPGLGTQSPVPRTSAPVPSGGESLALKAPEPPEMHTLQQQTPQQQKSSSPQGQAQNQQQQQVGQQSSASVQASAPAPAPKPDQSPDPVSKLVSVPDLSGMAFEEAKAAFSGLGLLIKVTGQQHSELVPEGRVLSQDAPPGFEAQPGATVAVTLSSGPPPTPQGATEEQINRIQARVSASTGTSTTAAESGPADNTRAWVARNNRAINAPGGEAASSRR